MDQDQEKRKSSLDHANDLINFGQNAYYGGKNLARLGKLISAGRTALIAASTSEVWGPIAIVLIIILVPTFLIVMGGKGQASETSETPETQPQTQESTLTTEGATISTNFNSYFCQGASKWQSPSCKLATFGCSPTSLAMILNSFGTKISPPEVANKYFDGAGCNRPTDVANYISKIQDIGFTVGPNLVNGNTLNTVQAEKFIKDGYLIIAASGPYSCTSTNNCIGGTISGHEFVIQGVNLSQSSIIIRDPNSCTYGAAQDIENPLYNIKQVTFNNFGYFFHAYPIKKI